MCKLLFIIILSSFPYSCCVCNDAAELNRPHLEYKALIPPVPQQSKNYLNIANYNIRTSFKDLDTENAWEKRKDFYLKTIQSEDEARLLMQSMSDQLIESLNKYLSNSFIDSVYEKDHKCTTCNYSDKEPFPLIETEHFRIALKTSFDEKGILYGNFPYPYRLIIALKRHASFPTEQEWMELRTILTVLQTKVSNDIGAEYSSYSFLQDVYFKNKSKNDVVPDSPHFFLHFIFRFPKGVQVKDINFEDPNPYHQFEFSRPNMVKENVVKKNSNFIYKRAPDIINIQELMYGQLQFLKQKLSTHHFIGYSASEGMTLDEIKKDTYVKEILAIAYRPDRCECLDHGVRWISETPKKPSIGFSSSRERIIVWAKFKDLATGNIFFVFNAHYDHLGARKEYIEMEKETIQEIAQDHLWFAYGERFYQSFDGEKMYNHYLKSVGCSDVRDISILGHYGESGSWGGFADDPFAAPVKRGSFQCDTLDVGFTNARKNQILFSYSFSGAYDRKTKKVFRIDAPITEDFLLASDHFMTGIYVLLD